MPAINAQTASEAVTAGCALALNKDKHKWKSAFHRTPSQGTQAPWSTSPARRRTRTGPARHPAARWSACRARPRPTPGPGSCGCSCPCGLDGAPADDKVPNPDTSNTYSYEPTGDAGLDYALNFIGQRRHGDVHPAVIAATKGDSSDRSRAGNERTPGGAAQVVLCQAGIRAPRPGDGQAGSRAVRLRGPSCWLCREPGPWCVPGLLKKLCPRRRPRSTLPWRKVD